MTITEEVLKKVVSATVREVNPEQIILFGSYARGNAGPDSDLDLLVVERAQFGKDRSRHAEIKRIRRALWDFRVPIDVLVYTTDEVAQWRDSVNHIIARSLREGRVLYERP
jgi:predicted nucleotidyltransferase